MKKILTREEHYREALTLIPAMALDCDGYRTRSGLKGLINDLAKLAESALRLEPVLVDDSYKPAYRIKK